MYTLNKAGFRMDPCRTPRVDFRIPDLQSQFVGTTGDHARSF